jgi:hypothetical protein
MPIKYKPIQLNPDTTMRTKIEKAANAEHRKLGPMVLEICRRYFSEREAAKDAVKY